MFERISSLIGEDSLKRLSGIKVLIVGIGGVGGYAFETLVRSGVESIDIIDFDKIEESNLNRQVITDTKNIGSLKVEEAKNRAISINKNININTYTIFLDEQNITNILNNNYDFIIDACDSVNTKICLIENSFKYDYKLISCMGTAKKFNPELLTITTLDKTNYDPLARLLRKKCKDLKLNLKKINVVSSIEKTKDIDSLGSMMMVPATAGILCAYYVIKNTINI